MVALEGLLSVCCAFACSFILVLLRPEKEEISLQAASLSVKHEGVLCCSVVAIFILKQILLGLSSEHVVLEVFWSRLFVLASGINHAKVPNGNLV